MKDLKKYLAELFGTMILVLFGVGSAVFAGNEIGLVGISMAFGISIVAAAYSIGHISGAHLNPAVSLSMFFANRMKLKETCFYIVSQIIGGILGASIVFIIATTAIEGGYDVLVLGLGANGFAEGTMLGAFIFETVATLVFTAVILGATSKNNINSAYAGLVIGFTLTAIHLIGIPLTGVSVNPARSIGSAIFTGIDAIKQLWLFIVAPILGGILSGVTYRLMHKKD